MSYRDYDPLIAPARPSAALWRLIVGLLVATVAYLLLGVFVMGFGGGVMNAVYDRSDGLDMLLDADTPLAVCIWLFSFAMMILALWLPLRFLHGRQLSDLVGNPRLALRQFLAVMGALAVLNLVLVPLPMPDLLTLTPHLEFSRWIMVLPLALVGLLIQVSAEELVFRGYLQSQLAARFAHPGVWIGVVRR